MPGKPRADYKVIDNILNRRKITESGCWEYTGFKDDLGYGRLSYRNRQSLVHRVFYFIQVGGFDIYGDICVLHKCDNPPCFNPEHLFLGTREDNLVDARTKGRLE